MNNLAYTITNNEFQFKPLLCKQSYNKYQWNNKGTTGCIHNGNLLSNFSYSVLEFYAYESLTLNYHPENADGFIFIINHLTASGYVQLVTENNLTADYSPRDVELYIIPAGKFFSFTFAPGTIGKTTQFFVSNGALNTMLSPGLMRMLHNRPVLAFSELLNESLYKEVCRQSDIFFRHTTEKINTDIIFSLLAILKNFNDFAGKMINSSYIFPHYAIMNSERYYEPFKKIA